MSRQLTEQGEASLVRRIPHPWVRWLVESQDEEKLAYYAYARSLAHTRGGSQDEEKILLLPPLLLVHTLVREIIILFEIYVF